MFRTSSAELKVILSMVCTVRKRAKNNFCYGFSRGLPNVGGLLGLHANNAEHCDIGAHILDQVRDGRECIADVERYDAYDQHTDDGAATGNVGCFLLVDR